MTEADEIAAILLPKYLWWNGTLPWEQRGHSMEKIRRWVRNQMKDSESYTIIDNVTEALIELVMPNKAPPP